MVAISGAHALLTNIVIAWNTSRMQGVVDRWRRQGMPIDDAWLRRMGPVHFGHINFRGVFSFGIERYRRVDPGAPYAHRQSLGMTKVSDPVARNLSGRAVGQGRAGSSIGEVTRVRDAPIRW